LTERIERRKTARNTSQLRALRSIPPLRNVQKEKNQLKSASKGKRKKKRKSRNPQQWSESNKGGQGKRNVNSQIEGKPIKTNSLDKKRKQNIAEKGGKSRMKRGGRNEGGISGKLLSSCRAHGRRSSEGNTICQFYNHGATQFDYYEREKRRFRRGGESQNVEGRITKNNRKEAFGVGGWGLAGEGRGVPDILHPRGRGINLKKASGEKKRGYWQSRKSLCRI